ncbi:MAG: hypothetical protein J6I40_01215 [Mailhella sp.]|nr:hypothetical protein [Mailhella sp.]
MLFIFFSLLLVCGIGLSSLCRQIVKWLPLALYWGVMNGLSVFVTEYSLDRAALSCASACGRIALVFMLGGVLCVFFTAVQLARAAEWYVRPVLPKTSWRIGLALAMMLSIIPEMGRMLSHARESARLRLRSRSLLQKTACIAKLCLQSVSERADSMAFSVAARRLDRPEPWQDRSPVPLFHWLISICLGAIEGLLFLL